MKFQKKKLKYLGTVKPFETAVKRFAYDGEKSVCFSREVDLDAGSAQLTVSVAMPKGSAPDEDWLSGLLGNFGLRQDLDICPFTNEAPSRTTYYYTQSLPIDEGYARKQWGTVRMPFPS